MGTGNTNNTCCCGNNCKCLGCNMSHMKMNMHHAYILKRFFFLAVIIMIFCLGVQIGELKGSRYSMHRGGYGMMNWGDDNYGYGKMMKIQLDAPKTEAAPVQ